MKAELNPWTLQRVGASTPLETSEREAVEPRQDLTEAAIEEISARVVAEHTIEELQSMQLRDKKIMGILPVHDAAVLAQPAGPLNKPSNPKDAVGSSKLAMELVPDTINAEVTLAFLEGALKYGRFNWRIAGVRASIYAAAMKRHTAKWWNGEDADKTTRVKHLASVIACAGILLDAELCGKLEDDRAPYAPFSDLLDSPEMLARIAHLKEMFKDHQPKQWTIKDAPAPKVPE